MRRILLFVFLGILIGSCAVTKKNKDGIRYFDENNKEISKSKFNRIRSTNKFLDIPGDSAHHKKLTFREKRGKITNRALLDTLLQQATDKNIEPDKPIVIVYYPGKDSCNSSGSATKESLKIWHQELKDGVELIAETQPIYIYKNKEGLEKYNGILNWHADPNKTIEKLFFEHHYPCSSFVVISKDGNYISYFGEFGKEYVWEATEIINK